MSNFTPTDWIELLKVISAMCVPVSMAYSIIAAARSKRAETASLANAISIHAVSGNVDRLEKNTNSISERNEAIATKLGIKEGIAQERASVLANAAPISVPDIKKTDG